MAEFSGVIYALLALHALPRHRWALCRLCLYVELTYKSKGLLCHPHAMLFMGRRFWPLYIYALDILLTTPTTCHISARPKRLLRPASLISITGQVLYSLIAYLFRIDMTLWIFYLMAMPMLRRCRCWEQPPHISRYLMMPGELVVN